MHSTLFELPATPRLQYQPKEFKLVSLRECPMSNPTIDTPEKVFEFWQEHVLRTPWLQPDKECLVEFLVNTRRRLIGFLLVSIGTLDTILVHPREVYRPAVNGNASALLVAHNHPSGDPTPSEADIKVTRDLIRAGQLLKIDLLDHIILGSSELRAQGKRPYVSLRDLGYFF